MDTKIHGSLLTMLREQTTGVKAQSVSRQNLPYHMSMDIGKAAIDTIVPHRELLVIDTEQVQDGRMNIIDLRGILTIERLVPPLV